MSIQPAAAKKPGLLRRMRHYRNIYLMLLPVIIFYILFHYVPMGGLAIAFENYKPAKGILGSDWVGLKNFRKFLTGIYGTPGGSRKRKSPGSASLTKSGRG